MCNFLRKVCRYVYHLPFRVVRYCVSLPERVCNRLHGLDFDALVSMTEAGHAGYQASSWDARRIIRNYLRGRISDKDAIIDIGCGKGRMLYFFSQFPFRHVDGLEYSQALIEIAQNNFAILRKLRKGGGAVRIFQGDAALYDAYDEYNYFYLYNPFNEIIMTPFLRHVKESAARHPRDIHIIYHNPVHYELFAAEGFTFVEELPIVMSPVKYYVYLLPEQKA